MKKNIYSLLLTEDIVAAVDTLAYQNRTSRSNMINEILAEYLSFSTPQKQMKDIITRLEEMVGAGGILRLQEGLSPTFFVAKTILRYKYKPAVRYSVELIAGRADVLGVFKVGLRTQSEAVLKRLSSFFVLWAKMEKAYKPSANHFYEIQPGRFLRYFTQPGGHCTSEEIGEAIGFYIESFDRLLQFYFSLEDREEKDKEAVLKEKFSQNPPWRAIHI